MLADASTKEHGYTFPNMYDFVIIVFSMVLFPFKGKLSVLMYLILVYVYDIQYFLKYW